MIYIHTPQRNKEKFLQRSYFERLKQACSSILASHVFALQWYHKTKGRRALPAQILAVSCISIFPRPGEPFDVTGDGCAHSQSSK